jgi:hypothetical protein
VSDAPKWKPNTGQKIARLYAWIATEPDGGEGVCAMLLQGRWTPLIGADGERIQSLRDHAGQIARETGYPVALKVFGEGVVIDRIEV